MDTQDPDLPRIQILLDLEIAPDALLILTAVKKGVVGPLVLEAPEEAFGDGVVVAQRCPKVLGYRRSSFHRYVKLGEYDKEWGASAEFFGDEWDHVE